MPKLDRSSIDLDRPCGTIRYIAGPRWNRVREAELVGGRHAIGHDLDAVPSCDCRDSSIEIDRRGPLQHSANTRLVV